MLMNVLPALRQMRTPLTAGLVLMVAVVVVVGIERLDEPQTTGLLRDLGRLVSAVGTTAALGVLTFTAYLAGVVWQAIWWGTLRGLGELVGSGTTKKVYTATPNAAFAGISPRLLQRLSEVVTGRLGKEVLITGTPAAEEYRGALARLTDIGKDGDAPALLTQIGSTALIPAAAQELLELVPTRLMAQEKELWAGWDQARSEAEFRSTIAVPLATLCAALAVVYHPLWWTGLTITPVLLRIARQNGQRATSILLEAVRAGKTVLFDQGTMPTVRWTVTTTTPHSPIGPSVTATSDFPTWRTRQVMSSQLRSE